MLPPEVSLDHIKGSAIAAGDLLSLHNLLQILLELFNVKKNGQLRYSDFSSTQYIHIELIPQLISEFDAYHRILF